MPRWIRDKLTSAFETAYSWPRAGLSPPREEGSDPGHSLEIARSTAHGFWMLAGAGAKKSTSWTVCATQRL
jgi:hypothetical protein